MEPSSNINYWAERIALKLFSDYVYIENYTKEKAINVLKNCVGAYFFLEILETNEDLVKSFLISETEQTY